MIRFSLQTRILLLVAGTVTGLALIVLFALAILANREVDRDVRNDAQASGGILSQILRERSAALTDQSLLLARQPALKQYLFNDGPIKQSDYATVSDYAREWLKPLHADAAMITDQDGQIVGQTDSAAQPGSAGSRGQSVVEALDGRTWRGVMARNGRLMLAVSVPVQVGGYTKGTFTAYRAIDATVAQELKQALGMEIAFVYQGQVMGASISLPGKIPTPKGAPALVQLAGSRYLALYAPLPDTPASANIGFVTLRPYDRAIARHRRFQRALGGILLLTLLLALAAGALVARGVTRPLDGVVQAARVLSLGEWPQRFETRRRDEVGLLQQVFNDMTAALRSSQDRLLALIDTDPLTGIDNHRRFQERLAQEAKRCAVSGEALSLLLLDLDHFQEYNRRYGHVAGDEALSRIAQLLRSHLPDVAILARYGGEEFVALLPQQSLGQAEALAEQIQSLIATTFGAMESGRQLSVSVGCAAFGTHTRHAGGLALAAELAVSRAKQLGRNRVCRFDSVTGADGDADPYQLYRYLKDGSLATIQALAAAVDAKDPYTQGHSQRVAEYAASLARNLGLNQAEVDLVFTTGTLHDVGKIGVPDGILKKPGRLDDEERAIMETHPVLGEVIVRKVPQLAETLPGVRHHHERWDGKGYPDGLAGESIPRLARLLAIADTFDAMTSDRPYRKGMAREIALQEILKQAGTQFDPDLAPAFVTMIRASGLSQQAA